MTHGTSGGIACCITSRVRARGYQLPFRQGQPGNEKAEAYAPAFPSSFGRDGYAPNESKGGLTRKQSATCRASRQIMFRQLRSTS